MGRDVFGSEPEALLRESLLAALSEDSPTREVLTRHRNELLDALLLIELGEKEEAEEMPRAESEGLEVDELLLSSWFIHRRSCFLYI